MANRNRVRIEGTIKNVPQAWDLRDGRKRAIFTVRVERDNGRYDYIDCCAYADAAESVEHIKPDVPVIINGWLMTFKQPHMRYKRTTLVVENWEHAR